jgi:hypothetical protein
LHGSFSAPKHKIKTAERPRYFQYNYNLADGANGGLWHDPVFRAALLRATKQSVKLSAQ